MLTICELLKPIYINFYEMAQNIKSCKSYDLQDFDMN